MLIWWYQHRLEIHQNPSIPSTYKYKYLSTLFDMLLDTLIDAFFGTLIEQFLHNFFKVRNSQTCGQGLQREEMWKASQSHGTCHPKPNMR